MVIIREGANVNSKKNHSIANKLRKYSRSYNFTGTIVGGLFVCLSFGPSLLPRAWYMQAVVSAVLFVFGYGFGVFISYIVRQFTLKSPSYTSRIKKVVYLALGVGYFFAMWLGYIWQQNSHQLMNIESPASYSMLGITLLMLAIIVLLIWVVRIVRSFFQFLRRQINKIMPHNIANALAIAATVFVLFGVIDGFLLQGAYSFVSNMFSVKNDTTPEGIERVNAPTVSGSDESLIRWESLGLQGRKFIGNVTTTKDLESFNGPAAGLSPVRIYAGLESASDVNARAELAAADLVRAGGLQRDVVLVVTTTGTGWVDEKGIDPIEYMYNGNSAIISMQYSYLPSWISFLVDQQKAKDAGIALYNAVYKEWVKLPVDQRPKLLSYGESLGSFGSEAAFPAVTSLQALSSGTVWVGPPNSNALWSNIVSHREAGSPMILPVYQNGATVRFAGRSGDLQYPNTEWTNPSAVYLQHASDPIVWWSPSLILNKPAWYNEPRGYDVNVATRWFPIITFWQITADMAFANSVPDGHGHKYGTLPVDAWAQVAPPPNWNAQKTQDLKNVLSN